MIKKNEVQYKCRSHKINKQLQIRLEIALFSKSISSVLLK